MRSARLSVMDRRAFSFRAHAGASHVGDIRCRPNAPYMDVHQWHTTDRHPYTEQRGRRFAPCQGSQAPLLKALNRLVGSRARAGWDSARMSRRFVTFPTARAACNRKSSTARLGQRCCFPASLRSAGRVILSMNQRVKIFDFA